MLPGRSQANWRGAAWGRKGRTAVGALGPGLSRAAGDGVGEKSLLGLSLYLGDVESRPRPLDDDTYLDEGDAVRLLLDEPCGVFERWCRSPRAFCRPRPSASPAPAESILLLVGGAEVAMAHWCNTKVAVAHTRTHT